MTAGRPAGHPRCEALRQRWLAAARRPAEASWASGGVLGDGRRWTEAATGAAPWRTSGHRRRRWRDGWRRWTRGPVSPRRGIVTAPLRATRRHARAGMCFFIVRGLAPSRCGLPFAHGTAKHPFTVPSPSLWNEGRRLGRRPSFLLCVPSCGTIGTHGDHLVRRHLRPLQGTRGCRRCRPVPLGRGTDRPRPDRRHRLVQPR